MWKHMTSNCVVVFHFPSVCVLMSISFWPTWRLAVISRAWQPITHLQLFTWEDTLKKCWLLMRMRMLQSDCNYLKWFLSQNLTKQFWMFAQETVYKELFRKNMVILPIFGNEKFSMVIACNLNCIYFWHLCKRLQNFVNVESLDTALYDVWSGSSLFAYVP